MAKKRDVVKRTPPRREPVYTVMAFITLMAITVGCALLYMDFDEYGQKSPPKEPVPTLPKLGDQGNPAPAGAGGSN